MPAITCIADLRRLARRHLPRAIFEYADGGSYDELTLRRNRGALDALCLRQRVMRDVSRLSTATTVLGQSWSMPVAIAPTGLTGLFHRDGEICGARAAADFGVPFTLSTMSICSIEDVAAAGAAPFWFQLYVMRDRAFTAELIARARAARCSALMLTVDLTQPATRRRDIHNGLCVPPRLTWSNALDLARHPRWVMGVMRGKRRTFGNIDGRLPGVSGLQTLSQWIATQFDPSLTWRDIEWVRSHWPGKLIVKGILEVEDARQAAAHGADALVVSNHGGRQLDGARSTIESLPAIAAAVGDRVEVLFDGGIASGQDVLKALASGARACLIGKSFLYALAAGGEPMVRRALQLLRAELEISMALAGCADLRQVREVLDEGS